MKCSPLGSGTLFGALRKKGFNHKEIMLAYRMYALGFYKPKSTINKGFKPIRDTLFEPF